METEIVYRKFKKKFLKINFLIKITLLKLDAPLVNFCQDLIVESAMWGVFHARVITKIAMCVNPTIYLKKAQKNVYILDAH